MLLILDMVVLMPVHSMLSSESCIQMFSGVSRVTSFTCLTADIEIGTISSSGVVEAIWDYWTYFEPIRVYAEQTCVHVTQKITNSMDNILIGSNNTALISELKSLWMLPNVTYNDDFMQVVMYGIEEWQGRNWDPAIGDPSFGLYCGNLSSSTLLYPYLNSSTATVQKMLKAGGYGSEVSSLTIPYLNWIGWLNGMYP
jgi:hypothetical protein